MGLLLSLADGIKSAFVRCSSAVHLTDFILLIVKNLGSIIKPLAIDFMIIYSGVRAGNSLMNFCTYSVL
jgi:hypothetical protein